MIDAKYDVLPSLCWDLGRAAGITPAIFSAGFVAFLIIILIVVRIVIDELPLDGPTPQTGVRRS
jgi:hypothetical protein